MQSQRKTLPKLSALALLIGIATGGVILIFRLLTEHLTSDLMPGTSHEEFEQLSTTSRFLLPVIGAFILAIIYKLTHPNHHAVGAPYLLQRLDYHQGHVPLKNTVMQFVGAAICLASGQSVGREGPAIHIGGGVSSAIAGLAKLSFAYRRTLIGCGVAAAISASFNTPLAGVVFAQEAILRQYNISSLTPLVISSVVASLVTESYFGEQVIFTTAPMVLNLTDYPSLIVLGLAIGVLAWIFCRMLIGWQKWNKLPKWYSLPIAGVITGIVAINAPEVMGVGYDTINTLLVGVSNWQWIIVILVIKLLLTSMVLGLGMPGGLIGPTLFLGACAGYIFGLTASSFAPEVHISLFCLIGMAAMMGATLHAPLAALITLLEMTNSPEVIAPGMIAIVMAYLINKGLLAEPPIFESLQQLRHDRDRTSAQSHSLENAGIMPIMDRRFAVVDRYISVAGIKHILAEHPRWLIIEVSLKPSNHQTPQAASYTLMQASDLSNWLNYQQAVINEEENPPFENIDLLSIPANRHDLGKINLKSNVYEAQAILENQLADALLIESSAAQGQKAKLLGIITPSDLEHFYSARKYANANASTATDNKEQP